MSGLFQGGPANRRELGFGRFPLYLRVVVDAAGKVDVLDQLEDVPAAGETIAVYYRDTAVHVCGRDRVRDSGWLAVYVHLPHVDAAALELADTETWRRWAQAQPAERTPTAV